MNTWEEPGTGLGRGGGGGGRDSFHPAMTSDCRPQLLDTIPPTSLRKARKINAVFKNWPSPLLLCVSKKTLQQLLYSSEVFLPGKQGKGYTQGHASLLTPRECELTPASNISKWT